MGTIKDTVSKDIQAQKAAGIVEKSEYDQALSQYNLNITDEEVKAAYRKMDLKHHPDRVATLGEDVRKAAEKKFQKINEAKERIFKERGL